MAKSSFSHSARKAVHQTLRKAFAFLPRNARFAMYRSFVDCDPSPDERLVLKIADTKEELEAMDRDSRVLPAHPFYPARFTQSVQAAAGSGLRSPL